MRAALILGATLLAAGCDDPAVEAKVDDILLHGIVAAQANCSCNLTRTTSPFDTRIHARDTYKLLDGACLVPTLGFCSRSDACAETCQIGTVELEDGLVKETSGGGLYTAPVDTCCTGFNHEAFGVEP